MVLCYHLPCSFKIFINMFAFLYVKANSKEICKEIYVSSFFRKMLMLMAAFLLRFKSHKIVWLPRVFIRSRQPANSGGYFRYQRRLLLLTFAILNFVFVLSVLFRLSCDHIISVLSRSAQQ